MHDARAAGDSGFVVITADTRPDLWEEAEPSFRDVWPEYNRRGDVSGQYFGALTPRYAYLQFLVVDAASEQVVARGRTIPFAWDGTMADLPTGIEAIGLRALKASSSPTALSALAAEVATGQRGRGISGLVIGAMADLARDAGFESLVAPIRPSWKDRYPLIPIEQYATWTREDGLPFDPWMRVHVRLGGMHLRAEPRSMQITGSVAEWKEWTGMEFPADGRYVFPGGLASLSVCDGIGRYWEPNIWMLHRIEVP